MVQTRYLLIVVAVACFSTNAVGVRGARLRESPIVMRTFSLSQHTNSDLESECLLGLAGAKIGQGRYATVYALDESQLGPMMEKYGQDSGAKRIFNDLWEHMDPTKQYVIKLNWKDPWMVPQDGLTEFALHAEFANIGVAPLLVAGWVCDLPPSRRSLGSIQSVLVMERMVVSLGSFYTHICQEHTEDNEAEVTRLAALAQRAVVAVLERMAQRGVKHDAHLHNFMLDSEGRVRAIDFGLAKVDNNVDEDHEARKLVMLRKSVELVWLGYWRLHCLQEQLDAARLWRPGSEAVALGTPDDSELTLLGLEAIESLMEEPYGWDTFLPFVNTRLGREPLAAGLFDDTVVTN